MFSGLPPIATDTRTSSIGSFVPTAEVVVVREPTISVSHKRVFARAVGNPRIGKWPVTNKTGGNPLVSTTA